MPRLLGRFVLTLAATGLIAALNLTPALAQGSYPGGGYMSSSGGMAYRAPAYTGGSGYAAAPSYRPPSMYGSYGMQNPYMPSMSYGTNFYRVRFGDTLSHIALRFGTTVNALLRANPSIYNPNLIFAGMTLAIPRANPHATYGSGYSASSYGYSAAPQSGYGY